MENAADQEAPVVVETVSYPAMTQADLDAAIQRQYSESDNISVICSETKLLDTTPEDEGYSSPMSLSHSQPAYPVLESSESPDWAMDQTVPEEDLFPSLAETMAFSEDDLNLINEFLLGSPDVCLTEQPVVALETSTEVSLPEFDVLLNKDCEEDAKSVSVKREVKKSQLAASVMEDTGNIQEDVEDDTYEEESGYTDDDDEDYIPPGRSKHQQRKTSHHRSYHEYDNKIYSQLPSEKRTRRHSPQLWVFLLNCLCDKKLNPSIIAWEDRNAGIFKLKNSRCIAELWGKRLEKVQKKPMDYEKFSRAIRYYYRKRVILSHPKRLTYQFGPKAHGWQKKLCGAAE